MKQSLAIFLILMFSEFICGSQIISKAYVSTAENPIQDAMVGSAGLINTNMGDLDFFNVLKDDNTTPIVYRSFIQFDLSDIPREAILLSAKLTLVTQTNSATNYDYSIERVLDNWTDSTITWNNQPATNLSDILKVEPPTSMSAIQETDVYEHVYHMLKTPFFNNGFCIKLWDESITGLDYGNSFYSSDEADTSKRPKLEITYMMPIEIEGIVSHGLAGGTGGSIDFTVTGGSENELRFFFLSKLDTTSSNVNGMSYTNVHGYNSATTSIRIDNNSIDVDSLEPGVYLAKAVDSLYQKLPNYGTVIGIELSTVKHFFVGEEGETTTISFTRDVDQMNAILYTNGSVPNSEYINYDGAVLGDLVRIGYSGTNVNTAKHEAYFDLLADFPSDLEFEKADLILSGHYLHYTNTSSNAIEVNVCSSDWQEETVSWDYRPAIDTNRTVYVEKINTSPDTIGILPLVEYWQSNPNYGFEMKLQSYEYPSGAFRAYSSFTKTKFGRFEASFTVKEPILSTFNDSTGLGSITVNAPVGDLPYTYLIGYDSIPELSVIWESIKDSIPIDSATFFGGKENSTSHTFENLKSEEYYVSVFDNNGQRLKHETIKLSPQLQVYNEDGLDISGNLITISNGYSYAYGTLLASLPEEKEGSILLDIVELGKFSIGFQNIGDPSLDSTNNMVYGISVEVDGTASVISNGQVIETFLLLNSTSIKLSIKTDVFELEVDDEIISSIDSENNLENGKSVGLVLGKTGSDLPRLEFILANFDFVARPFIVENEYYCNTNNGSVVTLTSHYSGYTINANVINLATNSETGYSGPSPMSLTFPAGVYLISYSVTNGTSTHNGGSQIVSVGNIIDWDQSSSINQAVQPDNTLYTDPISAANGQTKSSISFNSSTDVWIKFNAEFSNVPSNVIPYSEIAMVDALGVEYFRVKIRKFPFANWVYVQVFDNLGIQLNVPAIGNYSSEFFINYISGVSSTEINVYKDGNLISLSSNDFIPQDLNLNIVGKTGPYSSISDVYTSFCYQIPIHFVQLERKVSDGYYQVLSDDLLKVEYIEEYLDQDGQLTYNIKNKRQEIVLSNTTTNEAVQFGDNRIIFDVSGLINGHYYILEVKNEKDETFYLRFKKFGKNITNFFLHDSGQNYDSSLDN